MHMTRHVDRGRLMGLLAAAIAVFAAATTVAFIRSAQLDEAGNALSGIYRKALYETCEYTEGMAVDLSKLSAAGGGVRATLLSSIVRQAQGAQSNLALLPLSGPDMAQAMKYVNQAGDFASVMLARIATGGDLTEEEYADITRLSEAAAKLSIELGSLLERHEAGEIELSSVFTGTGSDVTGPIVEYPTMLYDGPFSDGAKGNDFAALEGLREVSQEEAAAIIREFIGAQEVIPDGESVPGTPCYEFTAVSGEHRLSAAVTKQGGKVLYVLSVSEVGEARLTDAECFRAAESFLLSRGFGDMEISYYSRYGGVMTINYAATQNGVILYPDLIKVQVAMDDGAIIGIEAGNYLRNHRVRAIEEAQMSEDDIRARIQPGLDIESIRLCIIPYGAGERYCYEASASSADGSYLIYLDAMTGAEINIMQVVGDKDSTLVM